jgi:hypothetical protein
VAKTKGKNLLALIILGSGQRRQALPVNKIEKPLGRAAGLFLPPLPLLHRGFADTQDGREYGLTDMVRQAYAPNIHGLKGPLGGQTKRFNLAHGNFIHGPGLEKLLGHFMGNIQNLSHGVEPPQLSLPLKAS